MANNQGSTKGIQVKSGPMLTGAALAGAGVLLAVAGFVVCSSHLVSATRRWMRDMEMAPSELAKLRWAQAKAAATAGSNAWQEIPANLADQRVGAPV
jgi:hypothetical protein